MRALYNDRPYVVLKTFKQRSSTMTNISHRSHYVVLALRDSVTFFCDDGLSEDCTAFFQMHLL